MAASKVFIGAKVFNKKGQQGEIVRIITRSTGYVEVNYAGINRKEMAFNLKDVNGEPLRKAPKSTTTQRQLSPIESLKAEILEAANTTKINMLAYELKFQQISVLLERIKLLDVFASKVAETVDQQMSGHTFKVANLSDKQAHCLASAAIASGIEFK